MSKLAVAELCHAHWILNFVKIKKVMYVAPSKTGKQGNIQNFCQSLTNFDFCFAINFWLEIAEKL